MNPTKMVQPQKEYLNALIVDEIRFIDNQLVCDGRWLNWQYAKNMCTYMCLCKFATIWIMAFYLYLWCLALTAVVCPTLCMCIYLHSCA